MSRRSKTGLLRVLQVTPGYFAEASLLGGGERYVENVCRSLAVADAEAECTVVSFGPKSDRFRSSVGTRYEIVRGDPEAPNTIDTGALQALLSRADVVHMHQCLSSAGMFVASHARLLGRPVIGSDHGGGVMPALHAQPRLAGIYDVLLAYSAFGETAFLDVDVPVRRIHGPVDDAQFIPARQGTRDRSLVITVGRILPHKGLHHVIAALPPGLSLIVAGRAYDPAYRQHLAQLAQGRSVSFQQDLDDAGLLRLMQRAGLCVHFSGHTGPGGEYYSKPELLGLSPLECLCTGLPVLSSRAGALRELEGLPGCRMVEAADRLRPALEAWGAGRLAEASPDVIRQAVVARYGLRQYGAAYTRLLREL